jgi:2-keto-4-pentenoate hydratase/2-oxohepta-3-ene-1,7-dioic acid hydratase in catechol pathway
VFAPNIALDLRIAEEVVDRFIKACIQLCEPSGFVREGSHMRLVTYVTQRERPRGGVLVEDRIVDLAAAQIGEHLSAAGGGLSVREALAAGLDLGRLYENAARLAGQGHHVTEAFRLGAPVADPDKILCVGLNYRDHAAESGLELPTAPVIFAKFRNSLAGPADQIVLPGESTRVDFEGELAVVIGRTTKGVPEEDALGHVAGAMVFNDVTARDLQHVTTQWTVGKAIDTFAPCGPALVTLDEVGSLDALRLVTRVNGTVVQEAGTDQMIFGVAELIARLSRTMTLAPGDIIATGTPAGVGFSRTPPLYLRPGDSVEVEIEPIGRISNTVAGAVDPVPA